VIAGGKVPEKARKVSNSLILTMTTSGVENVENAAEVD